MLRPALRDQAVHREAALLLHHRFLEGAFGVVRGGRGAVGPGSLATGSVAPGAVDPGAQGRLGGGGLGLLAAAPGAAPEPSVSGEDFHHIGLVVVGAALGEDPVLGGVAVAPGDRVVEAVLGVRGG